MEQDQPDVVVVGARIRNDSGEGPTGSWGRGPRTFLGLMTDRFPNLFFLTGPGSPSVLANMTLHNEFHADWIADLITHMRGLAATRVEPTAAVKDAVSACGHVIEGMAGFPASEQPSGSQCVERVRSCDVYVGVLGMRYGSPVRDRKDLSYTELEFEAATAAGLPRLVFLLDREADVTGIPVSELIDLDFGARQAAFRRRVSDSGLTTRSFRNPAELGQLVPGG